MRQIKVFILILTCLVLGKLTSDAAANHLIGKPTPGLVLPQHISQTEPIMIAEPPFAPSAASLYAIDMATAKTLVSHNADVKRPIASITKLATAIVILENHRPDEVITVPSLPGYQPADAKLGLVPGQRFTVAELMKALLIPSANDAADALAIADSGSIEAFSAKMNRLVAAWGIPDTHFASANGLQETDNYTSAISLAKIAKLALSHPTIASLAATQSGTVHDLTGQSYNINSTNQLLSDKRIRGLKTGYTILAGQSLVALAEVHGHQIITVVLNSPDRFGETKALIDWVERSFQWQ